MRNRGFSFASPSTVVSGRTHSSVSKMKYSQPGLPSAFLIGRFARTGMISSLNLPARMASAALRWLSQAKASCRSREMPYFSATFSAVMPMVSKLSG